MGDEIRTNSRDKLADDRTKDARQDWSRLYGRQISEEEYREIAENLYGFFSILKEWDEQEKKAK